MVGLSIKDLFPRIKGDGLLLFCCMNVVYVAGVCLGYCCCCVAVVYISMWGFSTSWGFLFGP